MDSIKVSTICFPVQKDKVLLGLKKRGFGEGKWNGFGGKVLLEENPEEAATRELREEVGLSTEPVGLKKMAVINFFDGDKPIFKCHVFLVRKWRGKAAESEEMKPQWFKLKEIPYREMWASDKIWIPLILRGVKFTGRVDFDLAGNILREFRIIRKGF